MAKEKRKVHVQFMVLILHPKIASLTERTVHVFKMVEEPVSAAYVHAILIKIGVPPIFQNDMGLIKNMQEAFSYRFPLPRHIPRLYFYLSFLQKSDDPEDERFRWICAGINFPLTEEQIKKYILAFQANARKIKALEVVELKDGEVCCPICFNDSKDEFILRRLPCSHVYHTECIATWLITNNKCPLCRLDITSTN